MAAFGSVISYPIPAYSNVPIESDFYQPKQFFISTVSLGQLTTVTTTADMDYVIGQLVKLLIPPSFGCRELNQRKGFVFSIPSPTQVVVGIDSSQNVSPFIASSSTTQPQIIAVGDVNSGVVNSTGRVLNGTFIPGSFINISPN